MSAHTERTMSPYVAEAIAASRSPHIYYCSSCGCGKRKEETVPAEEFHVIDPSGEIKQIVTYTVKCKKSDLALNFDRARNNTTKVTGPCFVGEPPKSEGSCATCVHATRVTVEIDANRFLNGKVREADVRGVRVSRGFYKCGHPSRSDETAAGTYMCAYIRCSNYKPK